MTTPHYDKMLLIRVLEDELQKLCLQGEAGDLHFYKGQEAIAVGVTSALRKTDYVVAHHRTMAPALAVDVPLVPLVGELLGKASGIANGVAGEMHLQYPPARFMFSFQLVGTCVPVAAGLAWAVKNIEGEGNLVTVFHGDAVTANGQWHEGLNLASVLNLPLLLICENNNLAGNVPSRYYNPVSPATRASAYGVQVRQVYGNDVEGVYDAALHAAAYVRETGRPYLLECQTFRLSWHKQGQRDIRSTEEIEELRLAHDPLLRAQQALGISDDEASDMYATMKENISLILDQVRGVA